MFRVAATGRRSVPGVVVGLLVLVGGCVAPQVRVVDPMCQRIEQGRERGDLRFIATVEARGLSGAQLIYEVSLRDAARRPVRSPDGRYQNRAGAVAASRTLMVLQSPATFEQVTLSIPVTALPARAGGRPAAALFRVYDLGGELLAEEVCAVPAEPRPAVAQQRAQPPPRRAAAAPREAAPPPRTARGARDSTARTREAPAERRVTAREAPSERRPAARTPARERQPEAAEPARRATTDDAPAVARDTAGKRDVLPAPLPAWSGSSLDRLQAWLMDYWTPEGGGAVGDVEDAVAGVPEAVAEPAPRGAAAARSAPAEPEAPARRARYVVQQGDTLTLIAARVLGDASRWEEIYDLNHEALGDPDRIYEGMVLWVPDEQSPSRRE